jgi:hypothetical protein
MDYQENLKKEFATVDLLLTNNEFSTGRTDAFVLTYVKFDKQIRKIFTYLVFQFEALRSSSDIIEVIASYKNLYPDNFIDGFDALYKTSFADIAGENYELYVNGDKERLKLMRNKILHGQLTGKGLDARKLTEEVVGIKNLMSIVAQKMHTEIGYDGLGKNSFRKSRIKDFASRFKSQIQSKNDLENFIESSMKGKKHAL